ncbi:hypothetical protein FB446DRAFT_791771 [Lentinula raphanica]|nr:hypothetical protein FB446DRAFT_791771 [Lentinula raphanica]
MTTKAGFRQAESEKDNGCWWLDMGGPVNGMLAVMRSLGDCSDKDECLIMACDGLWEMRFKNNQQPAMNNVAGQLCINPHGLLSAFWFGGKGYGL